jgi:membrane associated rhomboid family serine protease/tetratricopeptide (TPR) repeat protein
MSQPLTLRTDSGDEHLDLHEFEARVRRGEVSPQSLVRLPAITGETFVPACELEVFKALHEPKRAYFARAFSLSRFPWLTSALILLNLAIYLYTVRSGPLSLDDMVRFGAKADPMVTDLGELWRLFTANFLHRDALHIGLNMFVLFNVGGALENTYRTLDYLWLLVFSGVATMSASLWLSDAVSLGASGMVYGCLGAIVVFGLKYRAILPSRYRTIMSEAAIPTVLGLLLIGITSEGVDNWAHVGGLMAGLLTGLFMRPRLLADVGPRWAPALRAAPTLAIGCLLAFGPTLLGDQLPSMRHERDDVYGISVPVPKAWRHGADRYGTVAWNNGLPDFGRASFAAQAVEMPDGADAAAQAELFIEALRRLPGEVDLYDSAHASEPTVPGMTHGWDSQFARKAGAMVAFFSNDVLRVKVEPMVPSRIGERDALKVHAVLSERSGPTHVVAFFVPRGELVYQLVFKYSADFPRYAHVIEQMQAGIRFEERKALREARAQAALFPNSPSLLGRLGRALRRDGEPASAVEALKVAVRGEPSRVEIRRELALALLATGDVEGACESSQAAVLYAPDDPDSLEVDARCEVARGNPRRALERLSVARQLLPQDERLKAAEARLRASLGE